MNVRIQKLLSLYKNKALFINDSKDLFYLTGAPFENFYLLLFKKNIIVIVKELIEPQVKQYFKIK